MLRLRGHRRRGWRSGGRWKFLDILLAAAVLSLLALLSVRLDRMAAESHAGVPHISDGDSLAFGEMRIRLRGIDAPELGQTCRKAGADYPCGRMARDALSDLIGGRAVVCTGRQRDRYLRLLADCRAGDLDVNRKMVADGWAVAYGDFGAEEAKARQGGAGLWAGSFERPGEWRLVHGGAAESEHAGIAQIVAWLRQVLRLL